MPLNFGFDELELTASLVESTFWDEGDDGVVTHRREGEVVSAEH